MNLCFVSARVSACCKTSPSTTEAMFLSNNEQRSGVTAINSFAVLKPACFRQHIVCNSLSHVAFNHRAVRLVKLAMVDGFALDQTAVQEVGSII